MDLALEIVVWACVLAGSFFAIVGGIGLIRMPDLYTRLHGASVTDTLGAGLIFLGLMIESGFTLVSLKLAMIMLLLLLTSPTTAHAIAKAALMSGQQPHFENGTSS